MAPRGGELGILRSHQFSILLETVRINLDLYDAPQTCGHHILCGLQLPLDIKGDDVCWTSVRPLAPLQVRNNGVGPFAEPDPHRCAGFV
jgi:hypothetical protein